MIGVLFETNLMIVIKQENIYLQNRASWNDIKRINECVFGFQQTNVETLCNKRTTLYIFHHTCLNKHKNSDDTSMVFLTAW